MKTRLTSVTYLGFTGTDRRLSNAMLPWLFREIRATRVRDKLSIGIEDGCLKAYNGNFEPVIIHRLVDIIRVSPVPGRPEELFYILLNEKESLLNCFLFRANSANEVTELFSQMREPSPTSSRGSGTITKNLGFQQHAELPWSSANVSLPQNCSEHLASETPLVRSLSNASALMSLCADLSPSDSHFFEVLYIGKVRISQRKVPETLIDDALIKFAHHDAEKAKNFRRHSLLSSGTSLNSDSNESLERHEESINVPNLELNKNYTEKKKNKEVDDDFDSFTKERVKKPQNDIANTKQNLGTVTEDEEKNEEIRSCISETASSITQFCQTTLKKHDKNGNNENTESNNTFGTDVNQNLENVPDLLKTELKINEDVTEKKSREDSPSPHMNFEELPRKLRFTRNGSLPENKPFLRDRSASIGTLSMKTPISHVIGEQNRTMLFQVGRAELRLISPDRKQILLQRSFSDISSCVTGRSSREHVGFVCREGADSFACFVFRCESDRVATDLLHAVRQAFSSHAELLKKSREKSPSMTCEHCPMLWYHRLCHDIEGMNEKKSHAFILRRVEQLPPDEQESLVAKYQGGTGHLYEVSEHNAFLMMLLRAHCEAKQLRHVHDTAENRSEFLNQYLGGSTIFMKAKRSLSSGFDHLLKRKGSRDDHVLIKKEPSPLPQLAFVETSSEPSEPKTPDLLSPSLNRCKSLSPAILGDSNDSSTSALPIIDDENVEKEGTPVTSPMMDIFLKVSDSRPAPPGQGNEHDATWRQAIYETVLQPTDQQGDMEPKKGKRSKEELRALWKMAIEQTILLVRMENENARLRQNEESSAVRRMKLEYLELSATGAGSGPLWDALLARTGRLDTHMLAQAVKQGVPRMSRGAVWYFLAQQASLRSAPPDVKAFPHYHTPYRTLLADLTKHHHAILIDLGRTFPKHSYFASALGPGQLALFNVLKAYSLLDPDVGYCQGLSFVAGVLLLHMEEQEAFILLRHLMFRRGLRKQYLPDMQALQVQLYQLSRLLRDHEPELHAKFEELEVSPALYAAPWMLTLFTSQFPLGFVVGVFDLIFLESLDVVLSVSLALLSVHRDGLILSESCEEAAEYLKHKLPDMDSHAYNRVMKKVHSLDISRQLTEYAVEYSVLREEMPRLSALSEENTRLRTENARMGDQLDSAMDAINNYQTSQSRLESQNKLMDQQLTLLTRYVTAHHRHDLPLEIKKIVQTYTKKLSFSSKITSLTKFSTSEEEDDPRKNLKTGLSAPNLFAKISKEELLNAVNREKKSPEMDSKRFLMKKSLSVHSGLIANNLRQYPLKVLEEKAEAETFRRTESLKNDASLTESLKELGKKSSGFFANSHEQIRQERLFEQQLKHDFDENLKKLDAKLSPKHMGDVSSFQSRKCMSLNLTPSHDKNDSGFVTPLSPEDKKDDNCSIISHPLSDCDVDIKFDGQSTKLKQIRPVRPQTGIDAK